MKTSAATIVSVMNLFVAQTLMSFSIKAEGRGQKAEVPFCLFAPPFPDERHKDCDQLVRFLFPVERFFELHEAAVHPGGVPAFRSGAQRLAEVRTR
ncbi:MAG TPA: hypothetical protein VLV78_12955 [Thermoanaerobaculia bacterium]|nr:hypothetical protein [Thermoanaerobaculia bacterium]